MTSLVLFANLPYPGSVYTKGPQFFSQPPGSCQISKVSPPTKGHKKNYRYKVFQLFSISQGGVQGNAEQVFGVGNASSPSILEATKESYTAYIHASSWKGVASTRILLFRWFGRSIGNMTNSFMPRFNQFAYLETLPFLCRNTPLNRRCGHTSDLFSQVFVGTQKLFEGLVVDG